MWLEDIQLDLLSDMKSIWNMNQSNFVMKIIVSSYYVLFLPQFLVFR